MSLAYRFYDYTCLACDESFLTREMLDGSDLVCPRCGAGRVRRLSNGHSYVHKWALEELQSQAQDHRDRIKRLEEEWEDESKARGKAEKELLRIRRGAK